MAQRNVKEQIIEAAVETLHKKGFNATSVQDITEAAKVPKGSFYNHFDSKEELAVEAIDRYWRMVLSHLQELRNPDVAPMTRLERYFDRLANVARSGEYASGCMIGNMSTELADQSPLARGKLETVLEGWCSAIGGCLKEGQADGSIRADLDPQAAAEFLLNSWEGAVMRSKVDRDDAAFASFTKFAFSGLRALS